MIFNIFKRSIFEIGHCWPEIRIISNSFYFFDCLKIDATQNVSTTHELHRTCWRVVCFFFSSLSSISFPLSLKHTASIYLMMDFCILHFHQYMQPPLIVSHSHFVCACVSLGRTVFTYIQNTESQNGPTR